MAFIKAVLMIIGGAVIISVLAVACLGSSDGAPSTGASASSATPRMTAESYADLLAAEIDMIESMDAKTFTKSSASIMAAVQIFEEAAKTYNSGATFELSENAQSDRARLKRLISEKQVAAFPKLRDAYGPVMRAALWEANGTAKTIGAGFRTIEFSAPEFAANRNIAKFQTEVEPVLKRLRFTKVSYRWYEEASEYQYYTLTPPKDGEVVIWTAAGTPVPVQ